MIVKLLLWGFRVSGCQPGAVRGPGVPTPAKGSAAHSRFTDPYRHARTAGQTAMQMNCRPALGPVLREQSVRSWARGTVVTRMLGLLRAHGIIRKVPNTHPYTSTTKGREIRALLPLLANATVCQLSGLAA